MAYNHISIDIWCQFVFTGGWPLCFFLAGDETDRSKEGAEVGNHLGWAGAAAQARDNEQKSIMNQGSSQVMRGNTV